MQNLSVVKFIFFNRLCDPCGIARDNDFFLRPASLETRRAQREENELMKFRGHNTKFLFCRFPVAVVWNAGWKDHGLRLKAYGTR